MRQPRLVTNVLGSMVRFIGAGRSSVVSMPVVALAAVAVSVLHLAGSEARAGRSVVQDSATQSVAAATVSVLPAALQPAALLPSAHAGQAGARAEILAEIERHLARAGHAADLRTGASGNPVAAANADARAAGAGRQAGEQASGRPPLKLSDEQRKIAGFIAARYRVAVDDVQHFVAHAYRAARDFRLDPYLILAVVSIESSFNPDARSSKGAQGLMQVLTRVHTDKFAPFGGASAAFDPVANITVGSAILKEYLVRHGSVEGALKAYVGAALLSHDFGYGRKVLGERARIEAAAQGREPAAASATAAAAAAAPGKAPVGARQAEAPPVAEAAKPAEDPAISLFQVEAQPGKVDLSPVLAGEVGGTEAVTQLIDRLHKR